MEAIERHIGMSVAPWSAGAKTDTGQVTKKPRRHDKPHVRRAADEPQVRLLASGGTAEGIEVADIVALITRVAGIDGEAVSDVKLLERFALLSVPATEVDRVLETVSGEQVRGHELRLERVQA